jgi:hypothetical protein
MVINSLNNRVKRLLVEGITSDISLDVMLTNNRLSFIPKYGDKRMGTFRLTKVSDGFKFDGTILYDEYRTPNFKGVGTLVYLAIIKYISDEGLLVYSDDNLTSASSGVWNKLVNQGIAEYDGKNYKTILSKAKNLVTDITLN